MTGAYSVANWKFQLSSGSSFGAWIPNGQLYKGLRTCLVSLRVYSGFPGILARAETIELAQRVRGRKNREGLSPLPLAAPYIHDRYGWGATYGVQTNRLLFSHRGQ